MEQDLKKAGMKRCYACIQWEEQRTYYADKQLIKVDVGRTGNCLVLHKQVKGSHSCEEFFPLR
ncbi:MAG TPA: hypothetical protein PLW34_12075 [Termitinemataceae bacterium]|nr:hypothetical protein [Termitinemataceae bacterium]HOM24286.1 hypothetical protein [Termitinemataceae bacterium]HPQ01407.1 hypothetical protein [Termitinemataceae bacterium]